jgi:hypothetical protein
VYVRDWASAPRGALARFWCRGGVCWGPAGAAPVKLGLAAPDEPLVGALGPGGAPGSGFGGGLAIDGGLTFDQEPPGSKGGPELQ